MHFNRQIFARRAAKKQERLHFVRCDDEMATDASFWGLAGGKMSACGSGIGEIRASPHFCESCRCSESREKLQKGRKVAEKWSLQAEMSACCQLEADPDRKNGVEKQ